MSHKIFKNKIICRVIVRGGAGDGPKFGISEQMTEREIDSLLQSATSRQF